MKKGSIMVWAAFVMLLFGVVFMLVFSFTIRLAYYREYVFSGIKLERVINALENLKLKVREALSRSTGASVYDIARCGGSPSGLDLCRDCVPPVWRDEKGRYITSLSAVKNRIERRTGNMMRDHYDIYRRMVKEDSINITYPAAATRIEAIKNKEINVSLLSKDIKANSGSDTAVSSGKISTSINTRLRKLHSASRDFVNNNLKNDQNGKPISFYNVTREEAYSVFKDLPNSITLKKGSTYCDPVSYQDLSCRNRPGYDISEWAKEDKDLAWEKNKKANVNYILNSSDTGVRNINPDTKKYPLLHFDIAPAKSELDGIANLTKVTSRWNCTDCQNKTNVTNAVCCKTTSENRYNFVCCNWTTRVGEVVQHWSSIPFCTYFGGEYVNFSYCDPPSCSEKCSGYDDYDSNSVCTCIDYVTNYHKEKGKSCSTGSKVDPSNCGGCKSICKTWFEDGTSGTGDLCKCYDWKEYGYCYYTQTDIDPIIYCVRNGKTVTFRGRSCKKLPGGRCNEGPDFEYWKFYFDYKYNLSSSFLVSVMDKCLNYGAPYYKNGYCWNSTVYNFLIEYNFETGCGISQSYADYVRCLNGNSDFDNATEALGVTGEVCKVKDVNNKIYWVSMCRNPSYGDNFENLIKELSTCACRYKQALDGVKRDLRGIVSKHFKDLKNHEIEICNACADPYTPCNNQIYGGSTCGLCKNCDTANNKCVNCGVGRACGLYKNCSSGMRCT